MNDGLPLEGEAPASPRLRLPNPTILALLRGVVEGGDPGRYLLDPDAVAPWFEVAEAMGLVTRFHEPDATALGEGLCERLELAALPALGRPEVWPPVDRLFFPVGTAVRDVRPAFGDAGVVTGHTGRAVHVKVHSGGVMLIRARSLERLTPIL